MTEKTDKPAESVTDVATAAAHEQLDLARKIWLAGVGAYGRAFDEAQDRLGKITHSANEVFDHLVERGEKLEDMVRERLTKSDAAAKVGELVEKVQTYGEERQAALEARLDAMRKTVADVIAPLNPLAKKPSTDELLAKIEALTAEVEALKAAKKAPAKKAETVA